MLSWKIEVLMAARIILASLLGGLIGLERERHVGLAGIRTHAAVALGACLFGFISFNVVGPQEKLAYVGLSDPSRIAAQIVSGIGFLGAGIILRDKGNIRGLTTAASVWATASIGLAVANGMYILAITSSLIMIGLLSLYRLPGWQPWKQKNQRKYRQDD